MLFDREYHERLEAAPWNEDRVRAAIRTVASETVDRCDPKSWWPVHPLDERTGRDWGTLGLKIGAAGVLWALDALQCSGVVNLQRDAEEEVRRLLASYALSPEPPGFATVDGANRGLWFGESGVLLVSYQLAPSAERADALYDHVVANVGNETNSLIDGSPGTMLAAEAMAARVEDDRWQRAWLESAEQLWSEWRPAARFGCRLWGQRMPEGYRAHLGSIGLAGNVGVLAHAPDLLGPERMHALRRRTVEALDRFALLDEGLVNWAPWAGLERRAERVYPVQWCHGAPGMICWLADSGPLDEKLESLLLAGGELVWRAGPLADGPGLCHGTAGNGFSFLKLFRQTSDERWLSRARAFAMHAIAQSERHRARYGRGRFSLWTGDLGLALYLVECLSATSTFPTIDTWRSSTPSP